MSGHSGATAKLSGEAHKKEDAAHPHFDYLDFSHWPCPGPNQSPVDLHEIPSGQEEIHFVSGANRRFHPLSLSYPVNSGYRLLEGDANTVKLLELRGGFEGVTVGGSGPERFEIVNLHFHAPSEHTVEGRFFDMEMHIVHATAAQKFAVLGIFFEVSQERSPLLDAVINRQQLDLQSWLGAAIDSFYFYEGSLTTPPCSEGINWFVLTYGKRIALPATAGQVAFFTKQWAENLQFAHGHGNNRPVLPLGNRTLYKMIPARRP